MSNRVIGSRVDNDESYLFHLLLVEYLIDIYNLTWPSHKLSDRHNSLARLSTDPSREYRTIRCLTIIIRKTFIRSKQVTLQIFSSFSRRRVSLYFSFTVSFARFLNIIFTYFLFLFHSSERATQNIFVPETCVPGHAYLNCSIQPHENQCR